uniref:Uncharacterized protein n=1 Tax=Populus alba TaxID=43335 RepID=A0A4U5Q285_POPAL|nr:hypothetical protein D5086_0000149650 [Populus alba]
MTCCRCYRRRRRKPAGSDGSGGAREEAVVSVVVAAAPGIPVVAAVVVWMEIYCVVFVVVNHQSTLAVMDGWLRLVVCVVDFVAEIGVYCGGAAAMIWRDGKWRGEWPAVGKSLAVGSIESCRGLVVAGDARSALWRRWRR